MRRADGIEVVQGNRCAFFIHIGHALQLRKFLPDNIDIATCRIDFLFVVVDIKCLLVGRIVLQEGVSRNTGTRFNLASLGQLLLIRHEILEVCIRAL